MDGSTFNLKIRLSSKPKRGGEHLHATGDRKKEEKVTDVSTKNCVKNHEKGRKSQGHVSLWFIS